MDPVVLYHVLVKTALVVGVLLLYGLSGYGSLENIADSGPVTSSLDHTVTSSRSCPCRTEQLCQRITKVHENEVFAYSVSGANWKRYDWSKLTTVVPFWRLDDESLCYAHSQGVRVLANANMRVSDLTNGTAMDLWVEDKIRHVADNFLDGVNIDFESPIPSQNASERDGLTGYIRELTSRMKQKLPGSVVAVDVAWSADGIDDRYYDYKSIIDLVDLAFVMLYDERSQIRGDCVAWANSAYNNTKYGLDTFLKLDVGVNKLIVGIPWYGYRYTCLRYFPASNRCEIRRVPFRGVSCSDAAGSQVDYDVITTRLLPQSEAGRQWDIEALSPYFTLKDPDTGERIQVWYDDPESLTIKYDLSRTLGLRGVGMWNADSLDYNNTRMVESMWGILPARIT